MIRETAPKDDKVRVTRVLIEGFRGWGHLDVRPGSHVLLAGVPREGRTDLITALAWVLDADAARGAALSDLHQRLAISSRTAPSGPSSLDGTASGRARACTAGADLGCRLGRARVAAQAHLSYGYWCWTHHTMPATRAEPSAQHAPRTRLKSAVRPSLRAMGLVMFICSSPRWSPAGGAGQG
jgi:hypothetical protein